MKITAERLWELDTGEEQVEIFEAEWPEGMEVTEANCLRTVEIGFDIEWMAEDLLPPAAGVEYAKLQDIVWVEFVKRMNAARTTYLQALALAFWRVAK